MHEFKATLCKFDGSRVVLTLSIVDTLKYI